MLWCQKPTIVSNLRSFTFFLTHFCHSDKKQGDTEKCLREIIVLYIVEVPSQFILSLKKFPQGVVQCTHGQTPKEHN